MNEENITVFIYGSLLPGHMNHHVVAAYVISSRPGRIAGRLVDFGPYPALVRDDKAALEGRSVRGMWIVIDRNGLREMDRLEGFSGIDEDNDYDRVWTADAHQAEHCGWVYVWDTSRGYPPIMEEYWPTFYFSKMGAE
ncbi:hypothetical protein PAECIP111893_03473 [Paenibacillus plantiphilus]|uniref:Gamma-glutamylcyclotransferase AIG2-like domain-containing protein n=1 Tax=Paenibacillus plantiphilus TaxID=2905650 RepID=A0ABM9CHN4_9BACL|nr:gamma-glutamylcyclotransferase family protein [Paenibacillus plantiphilus]CAH1211784.1 hypothetical protein PAECIP111893_03473 [Paenibacillus plantiphilus]